MCAHTYEGTLTFTLLNRHMLSCTPHTHKHTHTHPGENGREGGNMGRKKLEAETENWRFKSEV